MNKKHFLWFVFLPAIFMFSSCESFSLYSCPYSVYGVQMVLIAPEADDCDEKKASVVFMIQNESKKDIVSFSVCFRLYDKDGSAVTVDSNAVSAVISETVPFGDCIEANLDILPYLADFPEEVYQVDGFFVKEIHFADGSVWSDPFGTFSEQELFE